MFPFPPFFPPPPPPTKQTLSHRNLFFNDENINIKKWKIEINSYNALQIFIFGFGLVTLLCLFYLYLCHHVCYVAFSTNLNLYSENIFFNISPLHLYIFITPNIRVALSECENEQILLFCICVNPNFGVHVVALKCCKIVSWTHFGTLSIYIFSIAVTPASWPMV